MSGPRGFLRRRGLRARITIAFVASAATLVLVVGLGTYLTVGQILQEQHLEGATRQTIFGLLFAREFVGDDESRSQRAVSLLKTREDLEALVTVDGSWFASSLELTPDAIPAGLQAFVADEKLAYEYAEVGQERAVVFGAPLPPVGVDLYLFYSLSDVERTLSLLARVLLVIGVLAVAIAALFALRLSRRILQPLAAVSGAAQQVAEGLLETRVAASSADELGALADSFNRMAAALQERIRRERRFVASVSHELRTPLATLEATSGLLAAHRGELSPEAREAVDLVSEDVTDLRRLVEELLETSELDGGTAQVRWERVDLRALVEAVLNRRHRAIPITGQNVVTFGDKARLERVVGNLVDNAFEHGEGDSVRARIDANGDWCEIEVADRGPGIPATDLPRIFDPFYKADASRTRHRGGVGLGLSIAQQNARLMGGAVLVRSVPDEGATFTVRIPKRDTAPPEAPEPEEAM